MHRSRWSLIAAIGLFVGCAPFSDLHRATTPFSLEGEVAALEVELRGMVSPASRSGDLLWGSVRNWHSTRLWLDNEAQRSKSLQGYLTTLLHSKGVLLSPPLLSEGDSSATIKPGRLLFLAWYTVGEREHWMQGRDRRGRRASLLQVERCAVVEGEGRWLTTGETVRFPVYARRCDSSVGQLRSDAYFRLNSWDYLLESALRAAGDDWLYQLHRSTYRPPALPEETP